MKFYLGSVIRFSCEFVVSSVDTDPTTVTFSTVDPAGVQTDYTYSGGQITKDSTGNYYIDIDINSVGTWHWRWVSTGTAAGAKEGFIKVEESAFD